jgi:hypothetical protein
MNPPDDQEDPQLAAQLDAIVASLIARERLKTATTFDVVDHTLPTEYQTPNGEWHTYTDPKMAEVRRLRTEVENTRAWRMIILWIAGIIILGLVVGHPTDPPWTTY